MSTYDERLRSPLSEIVTRLKLKNHGVEYRHVEDTYFGVLVLITIIEETDNGAVRRQLFAKMPQNDKDLRDAGVFEHLYKVESFFYTTLLPLYRSITKIDLSELFAECYYADTKQFEEVIILKDVREDGFQRHEGNRFLDFDHVVVSLNSLAIFHALSMILRNKQDNIDVEHALNVYSNDFPKEYMMYVKKVLIDNAEIFKDTKHKVFFDKLAANFDTAVNGCVHNAKHLVYGHGDFWEENIMYKYKDNKPLKACILDFQHSRFLSPAQDVLSFLLTSTEAKLRRMHYDFFLETYYSRLRGVLLEHSLDPDNIYPQNDFIFDLKTVSSYCFLTTNMSFSLWLGLEKDFSLSPNKKQFCGGKNEDNTAIAKYKQTMLEIADDFVTFGYYNI